MMARRLFFALWPTAAMQSELAAAVRPTMQAMRVGRATPRESLHLTLAFLGSVPESCIETLRAAVDHVRRTPGSAAARDAILDVTLDTVDYWPRSQLLCATPSREPAAAAAFADEVKHALSSAGFTPDLKPFRAHVTLARQVSRGPADRGMTPVRWTFCDFALVESRTGPDRSLYSVLESWPLFRA